MSKYEFMRGRRLAWIEYYPPGPHESIWDYYKRYTDVHPTNATYPGEFTSNVEDSGYKLVKISRGWSWIKS